MTSGAVQPPGSLGTEIVHTHVHDSSDDSDHTSFTDDEGELHPIQDEADEEERLIRAGGSGIPVGPVRFPNHFVLPCFSPTSGWRAQTPIAAHRT